MGGTGITREDLTDSLQRAKRDLLKLTEHRQSFAKEMYPVPSNPTPNHLTRMLDDLTALADEADTASTPKSVWEQHDQTLRSLRALRALLYRTSSPPDPFVDHQ